MFYAHVNRVVIGNVNLGSAIKNAAYPLFTSTTVPEADRACGGLSLSVTWEQFGGFALTREQLSFGSCDFTKTVLRALIANQSCLI